jgi:hypothetical protein
VLDVTDLTSTETKNEYNKTGRSGVRVRAEGGVGGAAVSQFDLSNSGSKTELHGSSSADVFFF